MDAFIIIVLIAVVLFVLSGVKVINQYERGVILTLGRYTGMLNPGLRVVMPIFHQVMKVDVRSMRIDVAKQEIITKENVSMNIDAVVYLRVVDASKAILETTNY